MIVIARPLNHKRPDVEKDYEMKYLLSKGEYWEYYHFLRHRRLFQAVGRLQRCNEDEGIVLVLDNRNGDGGILKQRY